MRSNIIEAYELIDDLMCINMNEGTMIDLEGNKLDPINTCEKLEAIKQALDNYINVIKVVADKTKGFYPEFKFDVIYDVVKKDLEEDFPEGYIVTGESE